MIRLEDYRLIGKIGKPHGHAGAVKLDLLSGISTDLNIEEPVFLLLEGKPVPFFMEECNEAAQPPILHFEDIISIDQAKQLQGTAIYANPDDVEGEDEFNAFAVVGYQVVDVQKGELGKITDILASGLQDLLLMSYLGKEIYIPLQSELIVSVDDAAKVIHMDLPDGLLEVYLDEGAEEEE